MVMRGKGSAAVGRDPRGWLVMRNLPVGSFVPTMERRPTMARRKDRLGAAAVLAAMTYFLLSVVQAPAAFAIPGPDCENASYNVEVTQGTQAGNHQGIKADVWFGDYSNDCNRITSLAVISSSGNGFVEWGWVLGYSSCNGVYYNNPRTFSWWKP